EVAQAERSPQVGEAEQEDEAEPEPEGRRVDLLPTEGSGAAPRHLPRHLRAGPRLEHGSARILHAAGRHFAGAAIPDADRPISEMLVVGRLGGAGTAPIAAEPL